MRRPYEPLHSYRERGPVEPLHSYIKILAPRSDFDFQGKSLPRNAFGPFQFTPEPSFRISILARRYRVRTKNCSRAILLSHSGNARTFDKLRYCSKCCHDTFADGPQDDTLAEPVDLPETSPLRDVCGFWLLVS